LITVSFVTPDMGVAAFVYLAAALILRARRVGPAWWASALLGATLGAAYLAKAVMFPLSFVFLGVSAPAGRTWRRAAGHLALASACFLLVAGSFVAVLSVTRGRLTFGDAGRLNYAWFVGGVPRLHWLGGLGGMPAHPPRKVFPSPEVYEFAQPNAGTYPLWYDPPYWYEGVETRVAVRDQFVASLHTAGDYLRLLFEELGLFTVPVLLLYFLALIGGGGSWRERFHWCIAGLARQYPLLVPALAAAGLYLLVGHVEGRLIGPFLVLLLASALVSVGARGGAVRVAGWSIGVSGLALAACLLYDAHNAFRALATGEGVTAHPAWRVANFLRRRGIGAGAGVGYIGYTFDAYWARLGGYRVVTEIPEKEAAKFWGADRVVRERVIRALQRAGAQAIVAEGVAPAAEGWISIPGTSYLVYNPANDEEDIYPRYATLSDDRR
jgi:4-amino-4-deoxy-L-arabinose transferase-like glycosyltransferase